MTGTEPETPKTQGLWTQRIPLEFNEALATVIATWQAEAAQLDERYGQAALSRLTLKHVEDIQRALDAIITATVSLAEASTASGYSADHLGRLIRESKVTNYGTKARPRVKLNELPRKISLRQHGTTPSLSRTQIVAAIAQEN